MALTPILLWPFFVALGGILDLILSIIGGLIAGYFVYRLIVLVFYAVQAGIKHANYLEREFGSDLAAVIRYEFTGKGRDNG